MGKRSTFDAGRFFPEQARNVVRTDQETPTAECDTGHDRDGRQLRCKNPLFLPDRQLFEKDIALLSPNLIQNKIEPEVMTFFNADWADQAD